MIVFPAAAAPTATAAAGFGELTIEKNKIRRRQALEEYFIEVTLCGEEGLVVKNLSSLYITGGDISKKYEFWVKVKPEYGGQVKDIDVVILAGYLGK